MTISQGEQSRQVELNPKGTLIGRSPRCDVTIDSKDVSRRHAKLFQDPFDRWLVEDLGSSNGTFINGQRITMHSVLPGEVTLVGPAALSISCPAEQRIEAEAAVESSNMVIEDFETEIFYKTQEPVQPSARPYPEQLDAISTRLAELTTLAALYPEVCRFLARAPKTMAAVLRLPQKTKPIPRTPEVLACHFGVSPDDTARQGAGALYPSALAFRISHRVLDAVRSTGHAVMAKSIYSSDTEITITAVDEHSPRAVICAALGEATQAVDLLYLDIPIDERAKESPEEMFAFVRIVAQEIASARKNLTPIHVQSERSALDRELWLAQQIQARLTPAAPAQLRGAEVAVEYKPVIWVDGDYCDVWSIEDGRLAFAVGHIFDKGLTAAMALSTLRTLLRTTMSFSSELSDVVRHVNTHLTASQPQRLSGTLLLGLFEPSTGTVTYVNAGHPEPLIAHGPQGVQTLGKSAEAVLGRGELELPMNTETLPLGAALVAFSQGVVNARSPREEHFGVKRLTHLLKTSATRSAGQLTGSILQAVNDFQDSVGQQHDISVVVLTRSR